MKKILFLIVVFFVIVGSSFAQTVTSVAGLDFGTSKKDALTYLVNHFGSDYDLKGDMYRFYEVTIGGLYYENAEFYFKDGKFVSSYFYRYYKLTEFSKAKAFRDEIFAVYKNKYHNLQEFIEGNIKCYAMGHSIYNNDEYYPIVIGLEKGDGTDGNEYYFVGVSYYNRVGIDDI